MWELMSKFSLTQMQSSVTASFRYCKTLLMLPFLSDVIIEMVIYLLKLELQNWKILKHCFVACGKGGLCSSTLSCYGSKLLVRALCIAELCNVRSCSQALLGLKFSAFLLHISLTFLLKYRNIKCQCVMEIRKGKNLIICDSVTEVKSCLLASSIKCDMSFQDFLLKKA